MPKILRIFVAVLAFVVVSSFPLLNASENIIPYFERFGSPFITQGEWAVYMVKATGQGGKVANGAPMVDYIALLEKNHIAPLDGWQEKVYLTFGVKAVTMVQALNLTPLLPENPTVQDYLWLLEGLGYHEGMPNEEVRRTDALKLNLNDPVYQEPVGNQYLLNLSPLAPHSPDTVQSLVE
jgi:hypothetical protein